MIQSTPQVSVELLNVDIIHASYKRFVEKTHYMGGTNASLTCLRLDALALQDAVHAAHAEPGASNPSQGVPGKDSVESDFELRNSKDISISFFDLVL